MHPLRFVATLGWVFVPGGFVMTDFGSNAGGGPVDTDGVNCRAHVTHGCYATVELAGMLFMAIFWATAATSGASSRAPGRFAGAHGQVVVRDITSTRSMVTLEFGRS